MRTKLPQVTQEAASQACACRRAAKQRDRNDGQWNSPNLKTLLEPFSTVDDQLRRLLQLADRNLREKNKGQLQRLLSQVTSTYAVWPILIFFKPAIECLHRVDLEATLLAISSA